MADQFFVDQHNEYEFVAANHETPPGLVFTVGEEVVVKGTSFLIKSVTDKAIVLRINGEQPQ